MFKSLSREKYLGYDEKTKLYRHQFKIIDSDFECLTSPWHEGHGLKRAGAVINVYKERNLNVAANLALFFKWQVKEYNYYNIDYAINFCRKYMPELNEYEKDLEKYLLLM